MSSHGLFDDVLLETTRGERRRRKLTLFATLAGEAVVLAALIAIPLLYLDAVPGYSVHASTLALPLTPAPAGEPDAPRDAGTPSARGGPSVVLIPVTDAPLDPRLSYGQARPRTGGGPNTGDSGPSAPWGCPGCVPGGTGTNLIAAANIPPPPHRPVISRVDEAMILHRVDPVYPSLAKLTRVQGEVVLRAIIGKDGRIEGLQVVSGHPLLTSAAVGAVSQWRFRPYQLNGTPVEVEAQVTVRFILGGR
ncbi:MAG: TonB family protein [Acidobacteriota bacterium]|nr:TonB family protein [Acidobacteriota bacterium]